MIQSWSLQRATIRKFLKTYGSIESLLENAHEIKGKLGEKIQANKKQGLLSKELAKIILDVPVNFEPENYKLQKPDQSKVNSLFEELEFRRIAESFNKIFLVQEEKNSHENNINTSPYIIQRYDDTKDELYMLEINTQPGMTRTSLTPEQANFLDIPRDEIDELISKGFLTGNTYTYNDN